MTDLIGKTLLHYKVVERIGQGGMGVVYKAEDTKLERTVAIKFLPRQISADAEARQRFKIEAKAAAGLNHPNIATIYAIEEAEDEMFIVMEYIDGEELKEKTKFGPLPVDKALDIAAQVAEGLKAAHNKGIVHRDIKSANIMITQTGQVKIMDFGLAKVRGGVQVTQVGTTLGTVAYMSPEQAHGEEVDHRTDLWSLGVVMYEMFSGQLPFKGDYEQVTVYSILHEEPEPLGELQSQIPPDLDALVRRALTKDRDQRYPDADALIADLKAFQTGDVASPNLSKKGTYPLRAKRNMLVASGAVVVLVTAFLFYVFRQEQAVPAQANSIAVMPFNFKGSEEDWQWLGDAIAELLNTDLAQKSNLQVLDAQQRMRAMNSLGIHGKSIDREQALRIAQKVKADHVVLGSLKKSENTIHVEAQIYNTQGGTLLAELGPAENSQSRLYEVADRLSSELLNKLRPDVNRGVTVNETKRPSLDVYRYYLEGRDAALDQRFQESTEKLEQAITLDSTFIDAYYWLAYAYSELDDDRKAKRILSKGKPYIASLSEEERLRYLSNEAGIEGRWQDYAAYLQQLLRINPNDAVDHLRFGFVQFKKFRQLDAGIAEMEKALQLDSTNSIAYNHLGYAYLAKGEPKKALEMIDKYIAANPTDLNPKDSKAEMQMLLGDYEGAIANCERILAVEPDFWLSRVVLVRTYIASGKFSRALQELSGLQQAENPNFRSIGQTLTSEIFFHKHDFTRALAAVEYAMVIDTANLEAHWLHGRILLKRNDRPELEEALEKLKQILTTTGGLDERWFSYHLQGEIALEEKAFSDAIGWFERALELGPLDRSFYLTALANAYQQSGQLQNAVRQYEAALSFNPQNAYAVFGMAQTYEKLGQPAKAKQTYKKMGEIWAGADENIEELQIAKSRLAEL